MKQQTSHLRILLTVLGTFLIALAPLTTFAGGGRDVGVGQLSTTQHTEGQKLYGFASVFPDGSWSVSVHGLAAGSYVFSIGTGGTYTGDTPLGTIEVDADGTGRACGLSGNVPGDWNIMRVRAASNGNPTGGTLMAATEGGDGKLQFVAP